MKRKLLILIVATAVVAGTFILIRLLDRSKEADALQDIQTATTNMMREMKPLTEPPIFPEKK